ncbi:MAG: exodeoxyribonuclease V subunit alpha [Thiotrichaceae bacterium]
MLTAVETLQQQGILSALDLHLAKFMHRLDAAHDSILLSVALTSYAVAHGHICLNLAAYAKQPFPVVTQDDEIVPIICPELDRWLSQLHASSIVGSAGEFKPLILQNNYLYFYRYWQYEQQLAYYIRLHLHKAEAVNFANLENGLQRLFAGSDALQQLAARRAVEQNFCIISGGPGTGKTSTVVKILALLLEQNPNLRIAVAAPTGKAAARLQEVITQYKQSLNCDNAIKQAIPQQSYTIHRLLGTKPHSIQFKSNVNNLLPYDVIVVDEASMIDLALMTKLAAAISPSARWILLGDKDQLASVEAGTVLGDICTPSDNGSKLQQYTVLLEKSYRFQNNSGIGQLAVKQGDNDAAMRSSVKNTQILFGMNSIRLKLSNKIY